MAKRIPYRFWIAVMIFFATYINFATRANMSVSIISMTKTKKKFVPECSLDSDANTSMNQRIDILKDNYFPDYGPRYDWDEDMQGQILSSYYYGYMVTTLLSGPISELWGPTAVIFWFTLVTGILNALCVPAAWCHYLILVALRFLMGMMGSCVYPALQVLIAKWAPPLEKGKFMGGLMGNCLATILNWPVISVLTVQFGWDWGFYFVSVETFLYCLALWFVSSDNPEDNKFISEEEVAYIKEAQAGRVTKKKHRPPYLKILKNKPFWVLTIANAGSLWGLYLQLTSIPKYMVEVIGYDLKNAGGLSMLPHLFRLFVGISIGFIGDWLQKKEVITSKGQRKVFTFFSHYIPGILLIGIGFCECNVGAIIFLLVASLGANGTSVLTTLVNPQDLAPNFSGTIFGLLSFFGGVTGFLVPIVTGALIRNHNGIKEWGKNFYIGGTVYLTSGIIFILFASVEEQPYNRIADQ